MTSKCGPGHNHSDERKSRSGPGVPAAPSQHEDYSCLLCLTRGLVWNCRAFLAVSHPLLPTRAQHSPPVLLVVFAGLQGKAASENQQGYHPGSNLRPKGAGGARW